MTVSLIQIPPKVFIAVPCARQSTTSQTTSSLIWASVGLTQLGMFGGFGTLQFPDIAECRSMFLSLWFDKALTSHLLFVDDDMGFNPQLITDMLSLDKPLVGVIAPKRALPIEYVGRPMAAPNCKVINGFMEADGVGAGIMLIRRDCVGAIIDKFPDVIDDISVKNHAAAGFLSEHKITRLIKAFAKMKVEGEEFSEDLSFCIRWREAAPQEFRDSADGKGEIWANITHEISHVGPYEFTGRYHDVIGDRIKSGLPEVPMAAE